MNVCTSCSAHLTVIRHIGRNLLDIEVRRKTGGVLPDGRWVAYVSDESAQYQVWVQSFPTGTGTWQISTDHRAAYGTGRSIPRWRADGRELYYLSGDGKVMGVDVKVGETFKSGAPQVLFDAPVKTTQFDVAADGRRFLLPIPAEHTSEPVHVVLNWAAGLMR